MTTAQGQTRFQFFWGYFLVVSLTLLTYAMLGIVMRCYPAMPRIPTWLWETYLAIQALNRLQLGHEWVNDWRHNIDRLLFLFGGAMVAVSMLTQGALGKLVWVISTCVVAMWLLFRFVWTIAEGNYEHPLVNRAIGALAGSIVDLPIVVICAVALRNAAY